MSQQQPYQNGPRKASANTNTSGSSFSSSTLKETADSALEGIQKTWTKVPTPSRRTQVLIASGIALGVVGIAAYVVARRKPRLGVLGSLMGPAMVAWSAYQKAVAKGREEIKSHLH